MALIAMLAAPAARAHHGWAWTTGKSIELSGTITAVKLGNPHGVITVDVGGTSWSAEVGQPWRNAEAGIKDGDLAPGVAVRIVGEPSADPNEKRIKVVRLYLGAKEHILYSDR
ncbi:MAG: DUF6152 family protein [Hyphomicrobiaceae bacterium]|nr:DUF6152 family protein [Hyphomicrobiaceae bacterium]